MNTAWIAAALIGCLAVPAASSATAQPKPITAWTHEDATSPQFQVLRQSAESFNRQQHRYQVKIVSSARRIYANWIHSEAATGSLPCLLEFDGPYLPAFAWPGYLQPIDQFVPAAMLRDFLPSIVAQGSYRGRLYSLGQYDSGLGLWGNRRYLQAAGVRIPTPDAPWNLEQFEQALAKLAALKEVEYAISLGLHNKPSGEFFSYAYAPILQGFGGDLIDRHTYRNAKGVLDGPQSVTAMKHFQRWVQQGWGRGATARFDDFDKGKAALSWIGNWAYQRYDKALGKDLVALPLPDFGQGIKTGMGSWAWGMSSTCREPAGAWAFLAHLLSTKEILHMTSVSNGIPARRTAMVRSPLYGAQGPLHFYVRQLETSGVARPATPAYDTISKAFGEAVARIAAGADVQAELTKAAATIDQDIATHRGYPHR